mmetsp:Transcript_21393/g.45209  ORF Transcript_21393/g.45209 Transcript_21393/m.45209 type:complete len:450 (+) Transcript_21393:505-1854(+)
MISEHHYGIAHTRHILNHGQMIVQGGIGHVGVVNHFVIGTVTDGDGIVNFIFENVLQVIVEECLAKVINVVFGFEFRVAWVVIASFVCSKNQRKEILIKHICKWHWQIRDHLLIRQSHLGPLPNILGGVIGIQILVRCQILITSGILQVGVDEVNVGGAVGVGQPREVLWHLEGPFIHGNSSFRHLNAREMNRRPAHTSKRMNIRIVQHVNASCNGNGRISTLGISHDIHAFVQLGTRSDTGSTTSIATRRAAHNNIVPHLQKERNGRRHIIILDHITSCTHPIFPISQSIGYQRIRSRTRREQSQQSRIRRISGNIRRPRRRRRLERIGRCRRIVNRRGDLPNDRHAGGTIDGFEEQTGHGATVREFTPGAVGQDLVGECAAGYDSIDFLAGGAYLVYAHVVHDHGCHCLGGLFSSQECRDDFGGDDVVGIFAGNGLVAFGHVAQKVQ